MTSSPLPASALPSSAGPTGRVDFPTWLPAMVVKELRQGLRTRGFVGAFIVFQLIMVLLMLSIVLGSRLGTANTRATLVTTINGFFWTILGAQMLLATPGRALGTLQVEVESRALDLLMLTRLTAWKIVVGKWSSLMAQALLLFTAMLPYGIVRYFMGSVDLVQDAQRCAALIGGCALLTAAGLAASGLPKIARIFGPIAVVTSLQIVPLMMSGMRRSPAFGGAAAFGGIGGTGAWLLWFDGACILGIYLVTAVRRIAPPAENHVVLSRGLALLTFLPVPLLAFWGKSPTALTQLQFAGLLVAIVAAVELASNRRPMMAHRRPWVARGAAVGLLGRVALPGWPSALMFAYVGAALVSAEIWLPGLPFRGGGEPPAWVVLLGLSGLAFPAVVLSFFPGRSSPAMYGLLLGAFSLMAAIAAVLANSTNTPEFLALANGIPVASFWITLFAPETGLPTVRIWQLLVSLAILGTGWWQSQSYWRRVADCDAALRAPKK